MASAVAGMTVSRLMDQVADDAPDAELAFPGERVTYRRLADGSVAAAVALRRLGVGPGDSVGVLAHGGVSVVDLIFATARLGAVVVPINVRFKSDEVGYVIDNADVRVLLVASELASVVRDALPSLAAARAGRLAPVESPALRRALILDGGPPDGAFESWPEVRSAAAGAEDLECRAVRGADTDIEPADPVLMMYTSGTTSRLRGCLHSHSTLIHEGAALADRLRLSDKDRFWTPLPFFHVGGFDVLFSSLCARASMQHVGVFDPSVALQQLAAERSTVAFPAFETIWLPVLDHPDFPTTDLSALRLVINVGPPERMRSMQERLPRAIQISCTGCTESMGFCCVGSMDDPAEVRATVSGPVVEGMEARVVDPKTGHGVRDGVVGEFLFRGAVRFLRYHRDPGLTDARIDADGWYHSGDAVTRDAEGRFTFVGRLVDRFKVGGENVSPAEVEDFLASHPAVRIVQVVAAPDTHYGEVGAAYVQLRPGIEASGQELIDFCRDRIATFKIPRYVRFVDEWPMSGTKIQKFRLRERIAAEIQESGVIEAPRITSTEQSQT